MAGVKTRGHGKHYDLSQMELGRIYALDSLRPFGLRPWLTLSEIYARYLESPGTKAYSVAEARQMFSAFTEVNIRIVLSPGDILESMAGQRHQGVLLSLARVIWPRTLLKRLVPKLGLGMLIEAKK
jgi:hypothetical protein